MLANSGISAWIIQGFLAKSIAEEHHIALEFLNRALDVLNWGRKAWKDIATEERGVIFCDTFLRGVKVMHMDCFMQVCVAHFFYVR